jgi:hypothetical protein
VSGGVETQQNQLVWSFTLTAPLAKLSATLTQILSAQQTISGNNSGLTLTFYVQGMQISPQLQQSQPCRQSDLLADAQAQAKQVAAAAGVSAGAILSMAAGSSGVLLLQLSPAAQLVSGDFTTVITNSFTYANTVVTTPSPTCSLTVQFQLM